jgi:REP-associated tyrosine transposase
VMNRSARRVQIFFGPADYLLFERLMVAAAERIPMRVLTYAIMPNHWHLVMWPFGDADLSRYMQWLTRTHAQAWHQAHRSVGTGAVYQGRFKAIPVQTDLHFLTVCRYVERNPKRARLVARATDWPWAGGGLAQRSLPCPTLAPWPVSRPGDWIDQIDREAGDAGFADLRRRIRQTLPYGEDPWISSVAGRLGLRGRLRGRGRPARGM